MLRNNFSTSTCFAIFDVINFMSFGSTLTYSHKGFLNPPRSKLNLRSPHPAASSTRPVLASKAVRAPATRAGLPASRRTLIPTVFWQQGCQPVFTKKSQTFSQKMPNSSFKVLVHKICITKHKTDFKTHQKYWYNAIPLFKSIYFPLNSTVVHLFLINKIVHY